MTTPSQPEAAVPPPPSTKPKPMTVAQVAALADVSAQGVRLAISGNTLKAKRLADGHWTIAREDAIAWIEARAALATDQARRAKAAMKRARKLK